MSNSENNRENNIPKARIYTGDGYTGSTSSGTAEGARRRSAVLQEEEQKKRQHSAKNRQERQQVRAQEKEKAAELKRRQEEEAAKKAEADAKKAAQAQQKAAQKAAAEAKKNEEAQRKAAEKAAAAARKKADAQLKKNKKEEELPRWQQLLNARKRKRRRIALCFVLLLLLGAYGAVGLHYTKYFYDGTEVFGIDCSKKTIEEVEQEVSVKLMDYELVVQSRDYEDQIITAEEIGLKYKDDGSISTLMRKQYPIIWPIRMLMGNSGVDEVAFEYDNAKAADAINHLECMDSLRMVKPRDAYMKATDEGFEIEPEVMGNTLVLDSTRDLILECLTEGKESVSLEEEDCYVKPDIYSDNEELVSKTEQMDALASANITYNFDSEQYVIDASVLEGWITQTKSGEYVIDDSYVIDFVTNLAEKYDTYGKVVEFHTTYDTTEYLYGGDYGWLMDEDVTIRELMNAIKEGYRGEMEPVWIEKGYSHENGSIGYTYVEICIHNQRMWLYKDGEMLVDTPVVTGNPNKNNGTPAGGVWKIDEKSRNATLKGEGYSTPVDYWLPFNDNIGIHDLQSRGAFGDSIYLYAGSHGCVNTPYDAVRTIYENVTVGVPVIVYE